MDYIRPNLPDGGVNAFICTECGDGFSVYSELLNHLTVHGPLDSFSLDGSFNGFDVAREYMLHENGTLTVVDRSGQTNSPSCGTPPSPTLQKPISPLPVLKSTSNVKSPGRPKEAVSTPVHYGCETCNKSFGSLRSLQQHQQYRKTEEGHKCTLCCNVFSDREKLKGHLQEHSHERFYCCGHCGKRYMKLESLFAHQKEQHQSLGSRSVKSDSNPKNSVEKTYPCKKCRLHFFWLSDLQSHSLGHCKNITKHNVTEPSTPEVKVQLLLNELSHNGQNNDISIKVKSHSDRASADTATSFRPYRCGLCGDRFQQLADLKTHHFTHQTKHDIDQTVPKGKKTTIPSRGRGRPARVKRSPGSKLHPCKYCHRVFNHSSSLSRHMRYHKGTLHTCVFCGRHFPQRCDVRRHIAMYHKNELEKKPGLKYLALHTRPEVGSKSILKTSDLKLNKSLDIVELKSNEEQSGRKSFKPPKSRVNYNCQECGKKFGLLCVYQRHLRYHKREPSRKMLKCPRCPSSFKLPSALKNHLDNHPAQLHREIFRKRRTSTTGSIQEPDIEQDNGEGLEDEENIEDLEGDQESSGKVLYECTECTETFSCLQRFLQHQTSHGSDNIDT